MEIDGYAGQLCESCLDRTTGQPGFHLLMKSFARPRAKAETCPHCGTTKADVERDGLAGCPLCFEVFQDVWRSFLGGA